MRLASKSESSAARNVESNPQYGASPRRLMGNRTHLIVAAFLLLIHVALGLALNEFVVVGDGPEYLRMAENLLAGRGFTYDGTSPVVGKPPGLPAVIAAYLYLVGSLSGFHLLQLLFMFCGFLAVAWIVTRVMGYAAGLVTLTVLTAADPLRDLAANLMAEPLFLFLLMLGIATLLSSLRRGSMTRAILSGFLFGMATYVRPVSLFWPIFLLAVIGVVDRRYIRIALVVAVVHVLAVAPWIARNAMTFGRFVPMVSNWAPLYVTTDESIWRQWSVGGWESAFSDPKMIDLIGSDFVFNWEPQERLRNATLLNIKADIPGWATRCFKQSLFAWTYVPGTKEWSWRRPILFWIGRSAMLGFYLLSAIGAATIWRRDRLLTAVIVCHTIYTAIILFPTQTESRYLIPAYVCLIPLTVCGAIRPILNRRKLSQDQSLATAGPL